jgi:hypothetical protein
MLLKYFRKQRASIYYPPTIDDLPFEVLRKAFLYLESKDLDSPSRVNRSWRPAAQDVQRAQLQIGHRHRETLDASLLCGIQLSRLVFGYESYSIKVIRHLMLDLGFVNQEYVTILARLVSNTLRNLEICGSNYAYLDQFFSQCQGIRNLSLIYFDFGEDPTIISQSLKDGFYRLSQLSLSHCEGDLKLFVESVPIPNLQSFSSNECFERGSDVVSAVAINYPTIKRLRLAKNYTSSNAPLLKFIECCRDIEELIYSVIGDPSLERGDIEAIASLPRLRSLNIECKIACDAVAALSRCRGLKHLAIMSRGSNVKSFLHPPSSFSQCLYDILPSIGRNLVSLVYTPSIPFVESFDLIVEHCPNLLMLAIRWDTREEYMRAGVCEMLKRGLKKLAKLEMGRVGRPVRLGTSWEGYFDYYYDL